MTRVTETSARDGVTVVIGAYNAASRLPRTLAHLQAQQDCEDIDWEVIVVDNGSTDATGSVARGLWTRPNVTLRVIWEPTQGVAHARLRGLAEAQYELLAIVDDDNWVAPDWVATARRVMSDHPAAGACGGLNEADFEVTPPAWLPPVASCLAIGPQGDADGDVTDSRGLLWGAGLVIRKTAWRQALEHIGTPKLSGRIGRSLAAGEDSELCLALRMAGWQLWYTPRLRLLHALPARRLTWDYFRALHRGGGEASPQLDPYHVALRHVGRWTLGDRLRWSWPWQAIHSVRRFVAHPIKALGSRFGWFEGDAYVLVIEGHIGRLMALARLRRTYTTAIRECVEKHSAVPAQVADGRPIGQQAT